MFFEYGAMSSKFRLEADNKLTAYVAMVVHYDTQAHLLMIYSPESSKEDVWLDFTGKISKRLDEIFGGEGAFNEYAEDHLDEIKKAVDSIKRLV
jgi:hypothetical protein